PQRRVYPEELKKEAVQMLLDGHSAPRWLKTSASAIPRCCTAGRPRFLAKKGGRPPLWRCACSSSNSNCAASSGSETSQKSFGHFQPGNLKQVYPVITQLESEGFPVVVVCQTLGVSRAGYYAHARQSDRPREQEDARLRP